jgi:hypothetical protein
MRIFIWPFILTVIVLFLFADIATPIVQSTSTERSLPIHKTLYLERAIYDSEMMYIIEAAIEWNIATDGQVIFDIEVLPQHNILMSDALIIYNVSIDNPDIILMDSNSHMITLGYFNERTMLPYIALVEERISDNRGVSVVLHELGHSLGLEHPNSKEHPEIGLGDLMYSNVDMGSDHITSGDLKQFCNLYHCDSSKLHGISEVQ